ncbi:AimR family lysis-lysogeny pheromone receptor [Bacillus horti]|uniref:Tetratricopeptide (TPR) repeat protein n=1 Tax=Caldalkalibacillus horti TaxID=77523 RepID=A0ABT9VVD5_9BACI|nr:AimR family lysis-lysogeny pheromone receptor [Bacillus horti]MDQ0164924.1 tetratricopeptide (TPR) repeat protein [Bacillus horti]
MVQEQILQIIENKEVAQRKLARIAGLSESSISRFLHGFEEVNFEAVLRMVKYLFPDKEFEIMKKYMLTQKSKNARISMEYCTVNRLHEELRELIENLASAVNPIDKEWAVMYQLILEHRGRKTPSYDLLTKVEVYKPKEIEMRVLKSILKGYIYYDLGQFGALSLHLKEAEVQIGEIKDGFLKDSFILRIDILMSMVYLLENNVEKAREYGKALLNKDWFEHTKAIAYSRLGHSYMFDDFYTSKMYLEKALKLYTEMEDWNNATIVEYDISFMSSYWKADQEHPKNLDDFEILTNYIYYLIQTGDKSFAEKLWNKIDVTALSERDQAFHWFYKGLLTDDTKYYYYSIDYFVKVSDYFHVRLPVDELLRLGENEEALKIFLRKGISHEKNKEIVLNR